MQEDDAIAFALLEIHRGDEKADINTSHPKEDGQDRENRDQFTGQGVKRLGRGKAKPGEDVMVAQVRFPLLRAGMR